MKNMYGLLFAVALGLAGGLLNWTYLAKKSRDLERVSYVGVKQGVALRPGDIFRPRTWSRSRFRRLTREIWRTTR